MAKLTRCDECKKLSDETGVSYIGTKHKVSRYRDKILQVVSNKDLCGDCVKKIVSECSISEDNGDWD